MTSKQAQRVRARAAGLCAVCCARIPAPGFKTCDVCRERSKTTSRQLYGYAKLAKQREAREFERQDLITVGVCALIDELPMDDLSDEQRVAMIHAGLALVELADAIGLDGTLECVDGFRKGLMERRGN